MADYVIVGSPDHGEDNLRTIASSAREALTMYSAAVHAGFRADQIRVTGPGGEALTKADLARLAEAEKDA